MFKKRKWSIRADLSKKCCYKIRIFAVSVLMIAILVCTVLARISPVIAMEQEPYGDFQEGYDEGDHKIYDGEEGVESSSETSNIEENSESSQSDREADSEEGLEDIAVNEEHLKKNEETEEKFYTAERQDESEILKFTYADEMVAGNILLPRVEGLPEDLNCMITKMEGTEGDYSALYQSASQSFVSEEKILSAIQIYRLNWLSGAEPYTLPEDAVPVIELTVTNAESDKGELVGLVFEDEERHQEAETGEQSTPNFEAVAKNGEVVENEAAADENKGAEEKEEPAENEEIEANLESFLREGAFEENAGERDDSKEVLHEYTAIAVPIENSTVSMSLEGANAFAWARSSAMIGGHYYKRVDSIEEIQRFYNNGYTEKYVIVYANKVMQAFGTNTWHTAPVEVEPVKGYENEGYFNLMYVYPNGTNGMYGYRNSQSNSNPFAYKDRHWQIKPHPDDYNAFYIWENENLADELWTSAYDGNKIYLDHDDVTNTWRIHGASYYMSYSENTNKPQNITDTSYLSQCNMLIFRYVGASCIIQI